MGLKDDEHTDDTTSRNTHYPNIPSITNGPGRTSKTEKWKQKDESTYRSFNRRANKENLRNTTRD